MKQERQALILEIIAKEEIETQGQLQEALGAHGVNVTQATLSRDVRELRLSKETRENGLYCYAVPKKNAEDHSQRLKKILKECVISYDLAQNFLVIHTLPGLASAAGSALDNMEIEGLVGTLAGDDTVFLAMRNVQSAEKLYEEIRELL